MNRRSSPASAVTPLLGGGNMNIHALANVNVNHSSLLSQSGFSPPRSAPLFLFCSAAGRRLLQNKTGPKKATSVRYCLRRVTEELRVRRVVRPGASTFDIREAAHRSRQLPQVHMVHVHDTPRLKGWLLSRTFGLVNAESPCRD